MDAAKGDNAQRDVDSVLKLDPTNASALTLRGQIHIAAGRVEQAEADFKTVLATNPNQRESDESITLKGIEITAISRSPDLKLDRFIE